MEEPLTIENSKLVQKFRQSPNWHEEVDTRPGEGIYFTPSFFGGHNVNNHIHFKNYHEGFPAFTIKVAGINSGPYRLDQFDNDNTVPNDYIKFYNRFNPAVIAQIKKQAKKRLVPRNVRAIQKKSQRGGEKFKTRKRRKTRKPRKRRKTRKPRKTRKRSNYTE
jgi:hypothetical protein